MASFEFSTVIAASPNEVWDVLADIERFPDWIEFIDSVTYLDEGQVGRGTAYRVYGGFGPLQSEHEWRVTAWKPPRWHTHQGKLGLIHPVVTFDIEPVDEKTRLTETVEFDFLPQFPRIGWWLEVVFVRQLLNLFIGQLIKPSFRQTVRNAKLLVESEQ